MKASKILFKYSFQINEITAIFLLESNYSFVSNGSYEENPQMEFY